MDENRREFFKAPADVRQKVDQLKDAIGPDEMVLKHLEAAAEIIRERNKKSRDGMTADEIDEAIERGFMND